MRTLLAVVVLLAAAAPAPAPTEAPEKLFAAGQQAHAAEDYEKAMELFEQATAAAPDVSRYHLWYGRACGMRADRIGMFGGFGLARKTLAAFRKAAEVDPANVEALNDLLEYYVAAPGIVGGGVEKAVPIAERLATISPPEGHRAQARILSKQKDWQGAEREYRKALALEPEKPGRMLDLASFLARRDRRQEADEWFDRAARLSPDSPDYLWARGSELARSKRNPQLARDLLERYLKASRKPDDPPASEARELLKKLG